MLVPFGVDQLDRQPDPVPRESSAALDQELDALPTLTGEAIGRSTRYRHDDGEYVQFLLANAPYLDGLRVGLDCANGASFEIAPRVFKQIGARLDVINQNPSGTNINLQLQKTVVSCLLPPIPRPEGRFRTNGSHQIVGSELLIVALIVSSLGHNHSGDWGYRR